jgi:5-methylthioadenosine/S-adenosylhomocysteine deaminase
MPAVLADLCIEARWIVPMTGPTRLLEDHALVVRDGRILDLLPAAAVPRQYVATSTVQRPAHLLMPGMINAATHAALSLFRGAPRADEQRCAGPEFARDGVLLAIADMLSAGITCFADRYYFPEETARAAAAQGMRAVIGLPIADAPSPWAGSAALHVTQALRVHDEYKDHPLISTRFALQPANALSDATFGRIATLADELDLGVAIDLHASAAEVAESGARFGMRPIERLRQLGLLTPALNAIHMTQAAPEDVDLARRTGISISLCPHADLKTGGCLPPVAAFAAAGIRVGLGSGDATAQQDLDLWSQMKLLALMLSAAGAAPAWDALSAATRGGAAVLGLEAAIGTLEPGKWADLCCVDLGGPATQPVTDAVTQLVFRGGRDLVSDVWVAGRQLVAAGEMTRLDRTAAAARAGDWAQRMNTGA